MQSEIYRSADLWQKVVGEISLLPESNLDGKAKTLDLVNGLEFVDRLNHLKPLWALSLLEKQVPRSVLRRVKVSNLREKHRNQLAVAAVSVLSQADQLNQVSLKKTPASPLPPKAPQPSQSPKSSSNTNPPSSGVVKNILAGS